MSKQQRYISDELTHFAGRGKNAAEQYTILLKILSEQEIHFSPEDVNTWGEHTMGFSYHYNEKISDNTMINPSMVCFCDIPFEDLGIHVNKYSVFGLSFKKEFVASKGGSPVFYIPKNAPVSYMDSISKADYFDSGCKQLYHYLDDYFCRSERFSNHIQVFHKLVFDHILSYVKFFDHTLLEDHADNYYYEREWRILGNLCFKIEDVQRVIIPESFAQDFRRDFPLYCGQLSFVNPS